MENHIESLNRELEPLMVRVKEHLLYQEISSIERLQYFMENHVFAVWDFMCLLKELYKKIVSTSAPWFPAKDPFSANLIGSILVDEEGDLAEDGKSYTSHFDLYINSMIQVGANINPINNFILSLRRGMELNEALSSIEINSAARKFVLKTFSFFKLDTHEIAAAFTYGREAITSIIFDPLIKNIQKNIDEKNNISSLTYYLSRHIELDKNDHLNKSITMLSRLVGNDEAKLEEARVAAVTALAARLEFLDDVYTALPSKAVLME